MDLPCGKYSALLIPMMRGGSSSSDGSDLRKDEISKGTRHLRKVGNLGIEKGKRIPIDVYELLSNTHRRDYLVRNNGDRVAISDAVVGRYLVIFCFLMPLSNTANHCRAMIAAYPELKDKGIDIEMVVVAKTTKAGDNNHESDQEEEKAAFDHFFSAFPCLAVPFDDHPCRDKICDLVGLGSDHSREHCACLVLDPDQNVLQTSSRCFEMFGAAAFPFTDDHIESILCREDEELKMRLDPVYREMYWKSTSKLKFDEVCKPLPLEELLGCTPSTLLRKGGLGGQEVEISVSDLSKRECVIVYLCYNGLYVGSLNNIQSTAAAQGHEVEILMVSFPGGPVESTYGIKEEEITSWWKFPSVDSVSRRLHRLCFTGEDSFMVWVDGGRDGELRGGPLTITAGIDTYPYTRRAWLENTLTSIRPLTLESLVGENAFVLLDDCFVNVSEFKNRNILFVVTHTRYLANYEDLCASYSHIKNSNPGSEMIFVPLDDKSSIDENENFLADMPWPILFLPPGHRFPSLIYQFSVVVFGADNKLKSLSRQEFKLKHNKWDSVFDDTLRGDLISYLHALLRC